MKTDPLDDPRRWEREALAERRTDRLEAALDKAIRSTLKDRMTISYGRGDVMIDEGTSNPNVTIDLRLIGHTPEELAAALGTIARELLKPK